VLGELENLAVIGAHPLEHATAIMQAMGQHMHLGVLPRDELPIHPDGAVALIVRGGGHENSPSNGRAFRATRRLKT
jgi:hypothetical protein